MSVPKASRTSRATPRPPTSLATFGATSTIFVSDVLSTSLAFRYHYAYDELVLLSSALQPASAGNGSSRVSTSRSAFLGPTLPAPPISSRNLWYDTRTDFRVLKPVPALRAGMQTHPENCVAGWAHVGLCFFGSSRSLRSHGGRFWGQAETPLLDRSLPIVGVRMLGTGTPISSSRSSPPETVPLARTVYAREVAQPRSLSPPPSHSLPSCSPLPSQATTHSGDFWRI
jgi:hypothetical protein